MSNTATATEEKHTAVAVLFRHGARSPTKSCLKCFVGTPIGDAWEKATIGELSETGIEQSRDLGRYLASTCPKDDASFSWLSSAKPRTLSSGRQCIEGFLQKLTEARNVCFDANKLGLSKPMVFDDPDLIFMPWYADKGFRELARGLKRGEDRTFTKKADEEKDFLKRMQSFMSEPFAQKPLTDALFRMTFFYEILECEAHWQAGDTRRSKFAQQVHATDVLKIRELARWVWNYQYFDLEPGRMLAGKLVKTLVENAREKDMMFISAHDFTILVLLSYLGVAKHPQALINFSAYVSMEIQFDGKVATKEREDAVPLPKPKLVSLRINADPFHGENRTSLLTDFERNIDVDTLKLCSA